MEALLATAIAARGDRGEEVDELMKKAASEAKAFKPAFSIGLRLKVATSLIEFGKPTLAKGVIREAVPEARRISNVVERVNSLRQIGQLLVRMGEWDYLHELTRDQGDPVAAAVFAVTVAEEAAKRNQLAEAKQWTSVALAASVRSEAGAYLA